jgi:F-box and WD-40 domain protein CDC4
MASVPSNHSGEAGSNVVQRQLVDSYATLGQLSMAPATQTTVITTTTTTTMSYPPFVMNAPRNLSERDSKEYPLAHTQAPESIRRFFFDAGGTQACFEEANDVKDKMQQVRLIDSGETLLRL